jgi:hypothetical protein
MAGNPFWTYWYFHIPNYLAAVVMYTLLGRFLLSFVYPPDASNYIWRFFRRITDWAVAIFGFISPRYIHPLLLPLTAAFWVFILRHAYFVLLLWMGSTPGATPS